MNSWNCISTNKNEAFLIQLALHSSGQRGSILTNQDSAFWTKFQLFGFLICMRMDQTGTRGGDFCLYKSAPVWLCECTFPFPSRLVSLAGAETLNRYCQSRMEQTSTGPSGPIRNRAKLSGWRGSCLHGCFTAEPCQN